MRIFSILFFITLAIICVLAGIYHQNAAGLRFLLAGVILVIIATLIGANDNQEYYSVRRKKQLK